MNEKDRILELVQKGIISSEEAITLLEKLSKQETQDTADSTTPSAEEYEAQDKKQFDTILEGIASTMSSFSLSFDDLEEMIDELDDQIDEKEDQIDEIEDQEELESLSVDQQMKVQRLKEELTVLQSQKTSLEEERENLRQARKQAKKEEMNEAIQKIKQKVEDTDWKQSANDSVEQFGNVMGRFAGKLAKAVTETVKNMTDTLQINGDVVINNTSNLKLRQPYHFEQLTNDLSIMTIKVANGDIRIKTANQDEVTIDGELRLRDDFKDKESIQAYLKERLTVSLDNDTLTVSIPSKKVYADLTIVVPDREYDYLSIKTLNAPIRLKSLKGKDYYLEAKNGDISLKDVTGTMLEAVNSNGDIKLFSGSFQDIVLNGTNGNLLLDAEVLSANLQTINGNVITKVKKQSSKHLQAKTVNGTVQFEVADTLEIEADLKTSLGSLKYDPAAYERVSREVGATTQAVVLRKQEQYVPITLYGRTTTGSVKLIQVQYTQDMNQEKGDTL